MNTMKKKLLLLLCCMTITTHSSFSDSSFVNKYKDKINRMTRNNITPLTKEQQKVLARITFYHNHQDQYGSKLANGGRAKQGVTIAAHPDFKMGTVVTIPKLKNVIGSDHFIVQDRGSAVTARRASKGKCYVFDIYVYAKGRRDGEKLIQQLSKELGDYAEVYF